MNSVLSFRAPFKQAQEGGSLGKKKEALALPRAKKPGKLSPKHATYIFAPPPPNRGDSQGNN